MVIRWIFIKDIRAKFLEEFGGGGFGVLDWERGEVLIERLVMGMCIKGFKRLQYYKDEGKGMSLQFRQRSTKASIHISRTGGRTRMR